MQRNNKARSKGSVKPSGRWGSNLEGLPPGGGISELPIPTAILLRMSHPSEQRCWVGTTQLQSDLGRNWTLACERPTLEPPFLPFSSVAVVKTSLCQSAMCQQVAL